VSSRNTLNDLLVTILRAIVDALTGSKQRTRSSGSTKRSGGGSSSRSTTTVRPAPSRPRSGSGSGGSTASSRGTATPRPRDAGEAPERGRFGDSATIEIAAPPHGSLAIAYSPKRDDAPDAGEIVWTWVPYQENDGRGKDRPVLVIARQDDDRVYAVRLTSKSHDGDRDFLSIGAGAWDGQGRESWVDLDQFYSVHRDGMRREAAALDRARFDRIAAVLQQRFGWKRG